VGATRWRGQAWPIGWNGCGSRLRGRLQRHLGKKYRDKR
jgi:hypothetical protein